LIEKKLILKKEELDDIKKIANKKYMEEKAFK
jgi:hypothetical protein